jgi:hypothetical protein
MPYTIGISPGAHSMIEFQPLLHSLFAGQLKIIRSLGKTRFDEIAHGLDHR